MSETSPAESLTLGRFPEAIAAEARANNLAQRDCVFAVRGDLDIDGRGREVWLVLTHYALLTLAPGETKPLRGPFALPDIHKTRSFQTVGSAFLQINVEGLYIDVIRYSNARREIFGRVRQQLERIISDQPLQPEALTKPSEQICGKCGLPLPGRNAACPRCAARRGIFRRTLGLMGPYWRFVAMLLIMMLLGVSLDLIPPQLTQLLVDGALKPVEPGKEGWLQRAISPFMPGERAAWLAPIVIALVITAAGRQLLNVFIGRFSSLIGTRITRELRERLQRRLIGVNVEYYDRHSVGSLMSRVLYDVDYFQGFVVHVAQGFLLNVMLVLGIGVMLFANNAHLATLVLLPIPFVIIGTTFFWKYIYPRYYPLWDSQSKMAQMLNGLLGGIRLVKAFGQEQREEARFSRAAAYMQNSRRSLDMSVATFNPIMSYIFQLGGMIIWYAGGNRVLGGELSLGALMLFFGYIGMFYGPISSLSMFSNWVTGFLTAGQRVFEVLDTQTTVADSPNARRVERIKGRIEFRNVTFGYDPYTPILKNVNLVIEPGQFIGIVGKSGSGKTSLVNLICRFYDAQQGEVLIDGIDVRHIAGEDLHRQVALVLQDPFLFRASIHENIAYGRPDAGPLDVMNAARAANAHDFVARMPGAYDKQLGERGAGLSGGERQRISIARALLCNPRILILDEATSNVDTESEQEIQKALAILGKGRTTIAIAHRLSTLKNSDHIYVIDEGRIVENGSHEQLLEQQGVYFKLVKIQTELTRLEGL